MHQSLATINSPEFINLSPLDINPLMSSCEIKVLYLGENRNHTFISREVAEDMAKTLRGAPIVGYYKEEKEDFRDHGHVVVIDDEGVHFEVKTFPYGFVSPDAKVWFQEFEDTNEFGETIIREYLMTTGYLWTGQFEECKIAVEDDGKPQSMELDEETIKGRWETNQRGMDFYIINDAIFSKLCILGDDIEPCFEGAKVSAPDVSASFTKVDEPTFRHTLFTMMQELQTALKGGQQMEDNVQVIEPVVENQVPPVENDVIPTDSFAASEPENPEDPAPAVEPEANPEPAPAEPQEPSTDPVDPEPAPAQEPETDPAPATDPEPEVDPQPSEFELLQTEHNELQARYSALETELNNLRVEFENLTTSHNNLLEFKRQIDDAKKDEMIGKFYMLSDDDKKDVVDNKANYTLEQIEEKLSVICFRNKVNFDLDDKSKNHNNVEYAVNVNAPVVNSTKPAWLSAVDQNKNKSI